MPYAIAANAIPIIAFAPITNAWFGTLSPWSKIVIAAVLCFFPVFVNTLRGLTSVRPESLELMRSYAASERAVFRRVRIPTSLPFVFSALKVASVLAMIGAVVGDYFGGSTTALGVQIQSSVALAQYETAWAAIVVASVLGIAFYATIALVERYALRWHPSSRLEVRRAKGEMQQTEVVCGGGGRRGRRRRSRPRASATARRLRRPAADEGHVPEQVGRAGAVRGLLRREGEGLLQADAGLDVTIKPGGPDISPGAGRARRRRRSSASTGCRACSRSATQGSDLVNIAQVYARSGTTEVTCKSSGINTFKKMKGKKFGVWILGNEFEQLAALVEERPRPEEGRDSSSSRTSTWSRSSTRRSTPRRR